MSVLLLGVLNRILRVEMGLDLLLVGVVLGGAHYLGALVAIPFGYYSDRHPLRGFYRTPYILAGIMVVCLALAAAPYLARGLAAHSSLPWAAGTFLFFLAEGICTYVAGTAYLALITDLTDEGERGRAVALIWTLLMVGILVGVLYTVLTLSQYSFEALALSFLLAGGGVLGLSLLALWRQEQRVKAQDPLKEASSLSASMKALFKSRQTRFFFAFLVVGLFATFLQDIVLEPFGGEVLQLSVRETSLFNAYLLVGLIGAMWLGGARLMPRFGKAWVTLAGAWVQIVGYGLLAATAWMEQAMLAPPAVLVLGVGMGWFTVGGVSLMMDMTQTGQTGLFIGAWTLASALARGPASVIASAIFTIVQRLGADSATAYATVFIFATICLVLAIRLLREVGVQRFQREMGRLGEVLTQVVD